MLNDEVIIFDSSLTRPNCNRRPDKRLQNSLGGFARMSRETAKRAIKTLV
jgi:hypothetical protein